MRLQCLLLAIATIGMQCRPAETTTPTQTIDAQGHRGARGLYPENTVAAMKAAIDYEMTTLEMDVVVTSDSVVILSHEPYFSHEIASTPNGDLITQEVEKSHNIYEMDYATVRLYDVGQRPHSRFPSQAKIASYKPTLAEVVKEVDRYSSYQPKYNIEIKRKPTNDGIYHPPMKDYADLVVKAVEDLGIAQVTTIQSFDITTLQYLHSAYPQMPLVLLVGDTLRTAEQQLQLLGFTPSTYSPYYKMVDSSLVSWCRSQQMDLIPWTVNDTADIARMLNLGVDGIISDYPDRLRTIINDKASHAVTH